MPTMEVGLRGLDPRVGLAAGLGRRIPGRRIPDVDFDTSAVVLEDLRIWSAACFQQRDEAKRDQTFWYSPTDASEDNWLPTRYVLWLLLMK